MPIKSSTKNEVKMFSLQDRYLCQIFDRFPEFKEVL